MNPYEVTFRTWNSIAAAYQEKFMALRLYDDTYDLFCSEIKAPAARILEIGCGPGNITGYLLKKHPEYRITGIDVAPAMIELAKQNNPGAAFIMMDCRELDRLQAIATAAAQPVPSRYDALLCGFCLPYLSKEDTEKLLADGSRLLEPGGLLYISAISGDYANSGFETSSDGQNKAFVYYYDEQLLQHLLEKGGFRVLHTIRKPYPGKEGKTDTHLVLIAEWSGNTGNP